MIFSALLFRCKKLQRLITFVKFATLYWGSDNNENSFGKFQFFGMITKAATSTFI